MPDSSAVASTRPAGSPEMAGLVQPRDLSLGDEEVGLVAQRRVDVGDVIKDELLDARDLLRVGVDGVAQLLEHAARQMLLARPPRPLPAAPDARVRALDEVVGAGDGQVGSLEVVRQGSSAVPAS
eukprot:760527-Hanusia_phi.AAC.1